MCVCVHLPTTYLHHCWSTDHCTTSLVCLTNKGGCDYITGHSRIMTQHNTTQGIKETYTHALGTNHGLTLEAISSVGALGSLYYTIKLAHAHAHTRTHTHTHTHTRRLRRCARGICMHAHVARNPTEPCLLLAPALTHSPDLT